MKTEEQTSNIYTSDASFLTWDYHFEQELSSGFLYLVPPNNTGDGNIIEINPCKGLFISAANWLPKKQMERYYRIKQKFIKIYYFESGDVTLIQNGKAAQKIMHGVNLYLNKPSQGRVIYGSNVPLRYISILIFENYIKNSIFSNIMKNKLQLEELLCWRSHDYNTDETGTIFMQLRNRLFIGTSSPAYYESKVCELLTIINENFKDESMLLKNAKLLIPKDELNALENVRRAIDRFPLNPPKMEKLMQVAHMSQTKLRETFKKVYGLPIGTYMQNIKLKRSIVLLSDDKLKIGEIAELLGYKSASKFSLAFKKAYGTTPQKYKKGKNLQ